MKYLCVFVLLFSCAMFAQSSIDTTSTGAFIQNTTAHPNALQVIDSSIIVVNINGNVSTGALGTLGLSTPDLSSGDFQNGATFSAGGMFTVNAPGLVDYVGNFSDATWTMGTLANGSHFYTLSGDLTSTEGPAAFACTTNVIPKGGQFVHSAKISSCQLHINQVF